MKTKAKIILNISLCILLIAGLGGCGLFQKSVSEPEDLTYVEVTYVIDGDTFVCETKSGDELRVRLIGVDAPESVHPDESKNSEEGVLASEYAKEILEGKRVGLEFDVQTEDQYGRTLAYVWLDGELFNKKILEDDHAVLMTIPPNVKYADYLQRQN